MMAMRQKGKERLLGRRERGRDERMVAEREFA